jgi:putative nucleotidyltransferase with HDIG domain
MSDSEQAPAASSLGMHNMVSVNSEHLPYYFETPLYYKASEGIGFELYKPSFQTMADARIRNERHPGTLYLHHKDKLTGLRELQAGLNTRLKSDFQTADPAQVKNTLISLVDETIKEPCADSIGGAVATMEIVFEEFVKNRSVIDRLVRVVATDYTTAAHSVNVMALVLRFCSFCGMKGPAARRLGLAALLHDVGKVKVHKRLLQAPRRLTEAEFEAMKKHTVYGHDILRAAGMEQDVCLVALNHHERVDGSGYPNGITEISEEAQIIAFIDCYEALTCNTRPYRDAVCPFEALSHIRHELFRGNFGTVVFEKFVKSLG